MGVFSKTATQKSFKMERKSEFASKLKSLILDHLLHFCPDYADEVLAEYITVLVCNGKNQNQARDDLEAFLGGRSGEYVSWLWRLLLKYERQLTAVVSSEQKEKTSSRPPDTDKENDNSNGKLGDLQSHGNSDCDNVMGEGEKIYYSSTRACESHDSLTSEDNPPLSEVTRTVQPRSSQSKFANGDSSTKIPSSLGKHQSKNTRNFEEVQKSISLQRRRPASSAHYSHGSESERPQIYYAANVLKRNLSPLVPISNSNKSRRSVWDRLGKPVKDVSYKGQFTDSYVINKSENAGERIYWLSSSLPVPTYRGTSSLGVLQIAEEGVRVPKKYDNSRGEDRAVKTISQVPSVSNIRRKRHFGELSSQTNCGTMIVKSANNQVEEVKPAFKRPEVPLEASESVVSQVQDVKLRLRQIEVEMAKLRSKQIDTEKDAKTNLSIDSGVVKPTEEEIESRTILVTNVHYKATKETLSMYFRKCGTIVNVAFLTDNIPAPQRSAYITFENKEFADKALGLSGTIFYSRTITVSRKEDMTGVSSSKFVGKRIHGPDSHLKSHVTSEKLAFPGSHLQWRRESLTSNPIAPASASDQTKAAPQSSIHQEPSAASV